MQRKNYKNKIGINKSTDEILVYGIHAVHGLLEKSSNKIKILFVQKNLRGKFAELLDSYSATIGNKIDYVAEDYLDDLTGGNHQGLVAMCEPQRVLNEIDLDKIIKLSENPFFLILDGVTDPHNLGACIRSAYAAGVDALIIPRDKSATLNATVRKVASGAAEFLPVIQVTNLVRVMQMLQENGIWVVGAEAGAHQEMYEVDMKTPLALVMGSEGKGMRRLTKENCDFTIRIPMINELESLNVSVAASILMYEALRQRNYA